jgi:hypothetical protein
MHRITGYALAAVVMTAVSTACGPSPKTLAAHSADSVRADSTARARQDSINRTLPGYVIDSAHTPEEDVRRFRAAFPGDSATRFIGGSSSRDALVRRFVRAIVESDTTDLRAMAVHAREFVDLYYPGSPYSHRPYYQPPVLAWALIQNPSTTGLTKLLRRLGGRPASYVGHMCDPRVEHDGATTRYAGCLVRTAGTAGDTITRRLFGSIVERNGQYKFLSYTNNF